MISPASQHKKKDAYFEEYSFLYYCQTLTTLGDLIVHSNHYSEMNLSETSRTDHQSKSVKTMNNFEIMILSTGLTKNKFEHRMGIKKINKEFFLFNGQS